MYNKPKVNDLAVVVCHYNWCNFYTPTRNLHRFIRQLGIQNIPVYGVELSLTGKFETAGMKNWTNITVTKENICFQKEACINITVKTIPMEITKIAWIDHDFMFSNLNWYEDASAALEKFKAIHLFSNYIGTDQFGRSRPPVSSIIKRGVSSTSSGARGCAWAARREMWNYGGLYPFSFLGGGDTLFIYTIWKIFTTDKFKYLTGMLENVNFKPYVDWEKSITGYITPDDVGNLDGEIIHEWHGDPTNRRYGDRYDIIKGMDFDKTLSLDSDGLVRIDNMPDSFYDSVMKYFMERNEDGLTNSHHGLDYFI
jgi:hypothetical protein